MARGASVRFSLRTRLQVLVAVLVSILVVGAGVNFTLVRQVDTSLQVLVEQLDPAFEAINVVEAALIDQQAAVSGFVLTGREETLEPYQRAIEREAAAMRLLTQRLEGLPASRGIPPALTRIGEWRTAVVEPQLSAKRARREADARALSATGETVFTAARTSVERVAQEVLAARDREQRSFNQARSGLIRAILANVVVAFLLVMIVTTFLRRWVTIPLIDLRRKVARVAGGEVRRAIEPSGPRELFALGSDVEAMRLRILAEAEESRRAAEGLAQGAPTVVALREALAPRNVRVPAGFEFASLFEPAEGVLAGDFFGVMDLPAGRIGLVLGDIAGHGAAPGIFGLRAKELFVAALRLGAQPAEAMGVVADQLGELEESFLTVIVVIIEKSGVFRYANAGHPPPMLCTAGGAITLNVTGPLLGPLPGRWETDELVLSPGASLVCYTDGVIEATNAAGEEFGADRLRQSVHENRHVGAKGIIRAAADGLRTFTGGRSRDDITMFALTRVAMPDE